MGDCARNVGIVNDIRNKRRKYMNKKLTTLLTMVIVFMFLTINCDAKVYPHHKSPWRTVHVGFFTKSKVTKLAKIDVFRFDPHWHYYDATWDRITFWKGGHSVKIDVDSIKTILFSPRSGWKFSELTKHVAVVLKDGTQHQLVLVMGKTMVTGAGPGPNGHNWAKPLNTIKIINF